MFEFFGNTISFNDTSNCTNYGYFNEIILKKKPITRIIMFIPSDFKRLNSSLEIKEINIIYSISFESFYPTTLTGTFRITSKKKKTSLYNKNFEGIIIHRD